MHSAPVIVKGGGGARGAREEMAYVGDIYGMLHAICTPHGKEKWLSTEFSHPFDSIIGSHAVYICIIRDIRRFDLWA